MITYSEAQATAFVTDPGTLKRGQELSRPRGWTQLGRNESAAWGACAGSGARPYLVSLDLTEPAFKCSCPSRVFPCKHGAGLLLLLAREPALFADSPPPSWAAEWLAKRQQAPARKADRPTPEAEATPAPETGPPGGPPAAAAPGAGLGPDPRRQARMAAGADELRAWLEDLVRAGLASLDQQPAAFWEAPAARLVDNQLPALAATLRELAALRPAHADWPARLLARLGELYLLVCAFGHRPQLPPEAQADLWQLVGVTIKKDELAARTAPVADTWLVLGQYQWDEDRLTARRSWLRSQRTGHYALVLDFSFGGQPFATALVPHGRYVGELIYDPGRLPLRAAPLGLRYDGRARTADAAGPGQSITGLLAGYAAALARQPWLREYPATLTQVLPAPQPDGSWRLHHATEPGTLPLRLPDENTGWQLLAESGGLPTTLFGEWDGQAFRPLGSFGHAGTATAAPASGQPAGAQAAASPAPAGLGAGGTQAGPVATVAGLAPPAWPALLRVALLGTRQSGDALPPYPTPAATREQQVLLAAGTLAVQRKAGFRPGPAAAPPPPPAPAETWLPLGPRGTDALQRLLAEPRYAAFLDDYLGQLGQHHRLVPPALLVPTLAPDERRRPLAGPAGAVLGERGRWLAQLNAAWRDLAPADAPPTLAAWETSPLPARRRFLGCLHRTDPAQARALLAAALPTEPASHQAALLAELAAALTPADAPLLEPCLLAKSKEVRQVAATLLARLPHSALAERLWQRAAPLLHVKRKALGKGKLLVALPEGWDKSWLADGIEQRTAAVEGGERAGWLGQLLALLPPARWLAHLDVASPAELLALADASEWQTLLLRAWARAATLHHDATFAVALLRYHAEHPTRLPPALADELAATLPPADYLAVLRELLPPATLAPSDALPQLLHQLPGPWPADLTEAVLRYAAEVLPPRITNTYSASYYALAGLLTDLARHAPPALLPRCLPPLLAAAAAYPLITPLTETLADHLRLRQQLDASFDEPPTH